MHRLFVAVDLPQAVKSALQGLCAGVPGAKWRRQDQLHLTLRFIGEVDGGVARDVCDALDGVQAPAFDIAVSGVGHFGDKRRPRVLWAGVDGVDPLKFLRERVERTLVNIGLEPEGRKYRPHVTLARLQGARMHDVTEFESLHGDFRSVTFHVDRFVLFSSFLSGAGAIYTAEAEYPLDAATVHSAAAPH